MKAAQFVKRGSPKVLHIESFDGRHCLPYATMIRNTRAVALIAATVLIALLSYAAAQKNPDAACAAEDKLQFICGLSGPEDLVQVPDTDWIIASSFAGLDQDQMGSFAGHLALLNPTTHMITKVALNAADTAQTPYAACSTPPDPANFSAHGLNIRREMKGKSALFVVGHGSREAIEVFEVDATAELPTLTWIGCVPAVKGAFNNSVVGLPDGRILVTDFLHGSATFDDLFANRKTGAVYQWTPGGVWEKLPGTELSGPNGIEVSPDQHYMFVADSGSATVLRFDLETTTERPVVIDPKPGFRTDNIRYSPNGQLLLAGTRADPTCPPDQKDCPEIFVVKTLDPASLSATTLFETPSTSTFSNLSSALIVDGTLWLGSPYGDRVAYIKLP